MTDSIIPNDVKELLTSIVGEERAQDAVDRADAASDHWNTLSRLMEQRGPADFFAYLETLSRSELNQVVMLGLTERIILRRAITSRAEKSDDHA